MLSENKTKKSLKSEVDSPDSPSFLGSAMNGNKNKNQKNDKNQIKNANPNPNREKREKRAIENINKNIFNNFLIAALAPYFFKNCRVPHPHLHTNPETHLRFIGNRSIFHR